MLAGSAPAGIPGLVAVPAAGLASLLMMVLSRGLVGRRIRGCRGSLSDHLATAGRRRPPGAALQRPAGPPGPWTSAAWRRRPPRNAAATSSPSRTPSNAAASPMAQMPGTDVRKSRPTTIPPAGAVRSPGAGGEAVPGDAFLGEDHQVPVHAAAVLEDDPGGGQYRSLPGWGQRRQAGRWCGRAGRHGRGAPPRPARRRLRCPRGSPAAAGPGPG